MTATPTTARGDTTTRSRRPRPSTVVAVGVTTLLAGAAWKAAHVRDLAGQYLWSGYSDIPPLFHAERLDLGAVPYLDHPVEYPVLTGAQMWLAGVPATDAVAFLWWTVALLVASLVATLVLLIREVGPTRTLVVAAAPTLLVSGAVNWDLPSVALATAGLVAHRRGHDAWAGTWLGLGTAAKLWPGLALLALVPAAAAQRGRRAGWATAGAAVAAWAVVNVPVLLVAPTNWARFLELNQERGIDWDPLWAVAQRTFGWHASADAVTWLSALLVAAGAATIVRMTTHRTTPDRWHHAVLPLVAWFLLVNKVWSPQFSLWLLPLLALTFPGWRWVLAFGAADVAVTLTRFRHVAAVVDDPVAQAGAWGAGPFDLALVVRAVVLAGAVAVGWRRATRGGPVPAPPPRADAPPISP